MAPSNRSYAVEDEEGRAQILDELPQSSKKIPPCFISLDSAYKQFGLRAKVST